MYNIETKITGVKIYRNGAETVRRGQAELKAGTNHLRIAGMTSQLGVLNGGWKTPGRRLDLLISVTPCSCQHHYSNAASLSSCCSLRCSS